MHNQSIVTKFSIITACLISAFTSLASADDYTFTKVADSDSLGVTLLSAAPVIDGDFVVFVAVVDPGVARQIWSWQISTKTLRKLVDENTAVPGGVGTFADVNAGFGGPVVKDGIVVFGAKDQSTSLASAPHHGIFTVPVTGGAVSLIANYNTPVPGGTGTFTGFGSNNQPAGNFSISQGVVVFQGSYDTDSKNGLFSASATGSNLSVFADSQHPLNPADPFPIKDFRWPSIESTKVAFIGATVFGPHGLYSATLPTSPGTAAELANNAAAANGGTVLPVLGDQFGFSAPSSANQVSGGLVGFRADGRNAQFGHYGIFTTPVDGGAITKIVTDQDITDALLPKVTPGSIANLSTFSLDSNGQVLFFAYDNTGQSQALFLYHNGVISKVIANDQLTHTNALGFPVYNLVGPQPGSLSNGRIVFAASSLSGGPRGAIYLAQPGQAVSQESIIIAAAKDLLTQANNQLKIARQIMPSKPSSNIPLKKRNAINAKRKAIAAARSSLKKIVSQLKSSEAASGITIRTQLKNFTASNVKLLNADLKNALLVQSRSSWSIVQKLLAKIGV